MRTTFYCLWIAGALRLAFDVMSQEVIIPTAKPKSMESSAPRCLIIAGGVSGAWLTINRADVHGYDQRGFDPCYTYLLSDPKPIVKKLPNGKWQIQFTSEIAEKLP